MKWTDGHTGMKIGLDMYFLQGAQEAWERSLVELADGIIDVMWILILTRCTW